MPCKNGKFKCSKCGVAVYRKETVLCRKCYDVSRRGTHRVDPVERKNRIKKYKQDYFQKNKTKIYNRRKLNPVSKEKREEYYIKSKYGISYEEYQRMLISRNHRCDICGYEQPPNAKRKQKLYIDHDHQTNQVRGLLCFSCNTAIGHLKDDVTNFKKALEYLKSWQEV